MTISDALHNLIVISGHVREDTFLTALYRYPVLNLHLIVTGAVMLIEWTITEQTVYTVRSLMAWVELTFSVFEKPARIIHGHLLPNKLLRSKQRTLVHDLLILSLLSSSKQAITTERSTTDLGGYCAYSCLLSWSFEVITV